MNLNLSVMDVQDLYSVYLLVAHNVNYPENCVRYFTKHTDIFTI